jgi:threonine synthase
MKGSAKSRAGFEKYIDTAYAPEESIVLRYRNALDFDMPPDEGAEYRALLQQLSLREGSQIFFLLNYRGVDIHIMDETSLMHTRTLKSIDGCVTIAACKLKGHSRVVFESGGNTGTSLTAYGQRAGLETFFFCPEENLSLLNSKVFEPARAHVISVKKPSWVKTTAQEFQKSGNLKHIPEIAWRYRASMLRGLFILEYMLENTGFDWVTQTISAAFGPVGIFRILEEFRKEIGYVPRFLGIQQEANCPMYRAWKSNRATIEPVYMNSTEPLLTKVMYDVRPQSYGSYDGLRKLLIDYNGDLTTINHAEFDNFLAEDYGGKSILGWFEENGLVITVKNGEVTEKTGLIALAGTLKNIDDGYIEKGSKVLCCLTSGISNADGKVEPEYRITDLNMIADYGRIVFGKESTQ